MATFDEMIFYLASIGVTDVLVPFMLVFVFIYAILQQTRILGHTIDAEGKKRPKPRFNLVIALVMGFSVVIPHVMRMYPPAFDPVIIINSMLPQASILLVTIISFGILVALWGVRWNLKEGGANWVIWFCILSVAYIFTTSSGYFGWIFPNWLGWLNNPANVSLLVTLLVFFGVIALITRDEKKSSMTKEERAAIFADKDRAREFLSREGYKKHFPVKRFK